LGAARGFDDATAMGKHSNLHQSCMAKVGALWTTHDMSSCVDATDKWIEATIRSDRSQCYRSLLACSQRLWDVCSPLEG